MAADEQNVYITGAAGGLADWAKEGTQSAIAQSLKQIQADNNQMLRFLHKIANGEKTSASSLSKLGAEIKQTRQTAATAADQAGARDTKKASTNRGIIESGRATLAALVGLRTDTQNETRSAQKREATYRDLLSQGFSESAANSGANTVASLSKHAKMMERAAGWAAALVTVFTMGKTAEEQGFNERFAMVSEMRQAGLLASIKRTEQGFINISSIISDAGFTFGEATDFVQHFSKMVGVVGVKSALEFSKKIANGPDIIAGGMDLMRKYTMNFTQVSKMSGDYLDSLRIAGQLQGRSDDELYSGMKDFMTNVEMTSNILKISMTDAAELMRQSLKAEDVALLATLPKEQREAIENGFLAMGANAQGNPMAETLAARLSAGSSAEFLQTAEYQQMAGTSVGREVLQFVEKMAQELEGGTSDSFATALAEQFPKFADQLTEMASQGGVRVQLLSDKQLASMVGSIITAAQNFNDADKGQADARGLVEDAAANNSQLQKQRAAVMSESAFTLYMDSFIANILETTKQQVILANAIAAAMKEFQPVSAGATNVVTTGENIIRATLSQLTDWLSPNTSNEKLMGELRKSGGMDNYQPDSKFGLGTIELGLNQKDNAPFMEQLSTMLSNSLSSTSAFEKIDMSTLSPADAMSMLVELQKEMNNVLGAMSMGYNKLQSDEGSRKEDESIALQYTDLRNVHITLQALAATLSNTVAQ